MQTQASSTTTNSSREHSKANQSWFTLTRETKTESEPGTTIVETLLIDNQGVVMTYEVYFTNSGSAENPQLNFLKYTLLSINPHQKHTLIKSHPLERILNKALRKYFGENLYSIPTEKTLKQCQTKQTHHFNVKINSPESSSGILAIAKSILNLFTPLPVFSKTI